jgi:hypothetical protein
MKNGYSVWQALIHGLAWGGVIAVLNGVAAPPLLELESFISSLLDGVRWTGSVGSVDPIIWAGISLIVAIFFSVPSIIGGSVLGLIVHRLALGHRRPEQLGLWMGVAVGSLVAWAGMAGFTMLIWQARAYRGQVDWTFMILATLWEMALYGWVGRRLARSYS